MLAIIGRYLLLGVHFTHVDDLLVAKANLIFKNNENYDVFIKSFLKKDYKINVWLIELSSNFYTFFKPFLFAFYISTTTTYAPLQFIFTSMILNKNYDYNNLLIMIRVISFISSIISFIFLIYFFKKISKKNFVSNSIIGITILATSWEHVIYSVQSSSYVIGVLSALILFYLVFRSLEKSKFTDSNYLIFSAIYISLLITAQYQIIFFIPGLFIIYTYFIFENKISINYKIIIFYFLIITIVLILYFLFIKRNMNGGVNWNMGPSKEYLFLYNKLGTIEALSYLIQFFTQNCYITLKSILSITNEDSIANDIYTILLTLFSLFGLISFFKSKNVKEKYLSYFTILSILSFLMLIMADKITLSPTRHSLIFLSFIVIYAPIGFEFLNQKLTFVKEKTNSAVLFSIIIFLFFLLGYKNIYNQRIDKFEQNEITSLINKNNIDAIYSYDNTWNLLFMKNVTDKYNYNSINGSNIFFYKKQNRIYKNIMLISHRQKIKSWDMVASFLKKNNIIYKNFKIIFRKESLSNTEICFSSKTKNLTSNYN